jgi:hypothetical protein
MSAAVFDCVVYLQAAINEQGPAAACLSLVESGRVKLLATPAILAEVRDVLSRDKLRKKFPHLTDARVEQFLQHIGHIAELLSDVPAVFASAVSGDIERFLACGCVSDSGCWSSVIEYSRTGCLARRKTVVVQVA